jgi:uncharacterized protein involved in response to NO
MASSPRADARAASTFFSYGFRPFFLGAALFGAFSLPLWLLLYVGGAELPSHLPPPLWHGHEMLFGYAAAVLAGFLLTATPSWSGQPPIRGRQLAWLAALWLAGRIAIGAGGIAPAVAASIDLAFLPALAVAMLPALKASAQRNRVFLLLLAAFFLANLWFHLATLDLVPASGSDALRFTLDLFALLIALVGGRVVPAFTANTLALETGAFDWVDRSALLALVCLIIADLLAPAALAGSIALLAALLHLIRLARWRGLATLESPILWVLHLGYAWLIAGLAWKGLVDLTGFAPRVEGLHGLAIGAVGTMTMGVMSRAALGHTGRPLAVRPLVATSYLLVSAATLVRLGATLLPGELYWPALLSSGLLWSIAFFAFLVVYAPILTGPRIDAASS